MEIHQFITWVRKDYYIIILCLVVLLGCFVTLFNVQTIMDSCNDHWQKNIELRYGGNAFESFDRNRDFVVPFSGQNWTNGPAQN